MILDLKPYPAMKDSGVSWLGRVPEHWNQLPGKACYREKKIPNTGLAETTVLSLSYGQIVVKPANSLHGLVPASFETYQIVDPRDIIVRPTDLQNDWNSLRFGLSRNRGIITSAYMCFRTQHALMREYGYLLLHAYDLKKIFYGLGCGLRQNLDWQDFKYLPCLVPPLPEQAGIVRFLDHADRLIRRYIRGKQKLTKLLEEQKQAIIHRAVTRGLDPNVRLKSAGVDWLGNVPEHWEVKRLRFVLQRNGYRAGPFGSALITSRLLQSGEVRVLSPEHIAKDSVCLEKDLFLPPDREVEMGQFLVRGGDVLFPIVGTLGRAMVVRATCGKAILNQRLARLRPDPAIVVPDYLCFLLSKVAMYKELVRVESKGSILEHITKERILNHFLPLPPIAEQRALLEYLDDKMSGLDRVRMTAEREISLLREYRIRLIADVVTGKLDVREAAEGLSNEVDKPESLDDIEPLTEGAEDGEGSDLDAATEEAEV